MSRIGPREPAVVPMTASRSLADLLWVANTAHGPAGHWFARPSPDDPDHDHLRDPADAVRYLLDHGVDAPPGMPDASALADLAAVREMTRALASPDAPGDWTSAAKALRNRTRFVLSDGGRLRADAEGWSAFAADLLLPLEALVADRDRIHACANPQCRLVFLDASKSGTRRWCDDGGCGNRHRVRRYRGAHR